MNDLNFIYCVLLKLYFLTMWKFQLKNWLSILHPCPWLNDLPNPAFYQTLPFIWFFSSLCFVSRDKTKDSVFFFFLIGENDDSCEIKMSSHVFWWDRCKRKRLSDIVFWRTDFRFLWIRVLKKKETSFIFSYSLKSCRLFDVSICH